MTPPFGLTDLQLFDERASRPEIFLDGSLEFFRLLAQPLDEPEHGFGLRSGG
jgi:hypothetical protein